MEMKRLAAFGRSENGTLDLEPGLNIIETSSEADRAAWTALLRAALYGPSAPFPGQITQVLLEAATLHGSVTITRWTAKADAPLGAFSAVYTGTDQAVEYLTAENCGLLLTGVPPEIFDERALIRPAAWKGDSPVYLERLTGILEPDLAEYMQLQGQITQLTDALARHDAADRRESAVAAENAHLDFSSARDKAKTLEASIKLPPPRETLLDLQTALDLLERQRGPIALAKQKADSALKAYEAAESVREAHPLALEPLEDPVLLPGEDPPPGISPWTLVLALPFAIGFGAGLLGLGGWPALPSILAGAIVLLLVLLVSFLRLLPKRSAWKAQHTGLAAQRAEDRAAYTILYEDAGEARTAYEEALRAYNAAKEDYDGARDQILNRLRSFRPFVKDIEDARQAIAAGLLLRHQLDQVREAEEDARQRWEARKADAVYPIPPPVQRPAESRRQLREQLAPLQNQMNVLLARFSDALEERAGGILVRLTQSQHHGDPANWDRLAYLAARLAACDLALPWTAPIVLDGVLDHLDGDVLTAALDCLTELSQTHQLLLMTCGGREAACLRRTHPDRFHVLKL